MTPRLGRPRVPWGQDPRAAVGIPLRWQLDTRRGWGALAELRRTGRTFADAYARGPSTDASALALTGRDDPASSAEVVRWSSSGTLAVDGWTIDELGTTGGLAYELARFVSPWAGVGIIEKIQTFVRLQSAEGLATGAELYSEGPLSTPIPALGLPVTQLGLVRLYALTVESQPEPPALSGGRLSALVIPPGALPDHPYTWFDARYATAQVLGHNQRLVVPRRSVVRLWVAFFRDFTVDPAPGVYVATCQGYLSGFNVAAGPTDAAYTSATLRGT